MARQYGADSEKGQLAREQKARDLENELIFKHKVEKYVSIGFLVLGAIILVVNIVSANSYKKKTAELYVQLNEAQTTLSGLSDTKADEAATTVELEAVASSASGAGDAVCVAQNDLIKAIKAEELSGQTELSTAHQEALNRLRTYFPKEGNNNLIRGTWTDIGVWEFNGVFEFEGDSMTVVWKCYGADDIDKERMLAFVTATYDSKTKTFTKGTLRKTSWYKTAATNYIVNEDEGEAYYDNPVSQDGVYSSENDLPSVGSSVIDAETYTDNQHLDDY